MTAIRYNAAMHWLSRLSHLSLALAFSFLSASVFLIYQYKQGIPYSFATNMTLAALLGLAAPVVAVVAFSFAARKASPAARFYVYYGVCLVIAGALGWITF